MIHRVRRKNKKKKARPSKPRYYKPQTSPVPAVESFLTLEEAIGSRMPPEEFQKIISRYDWQGLFVELSMLASVMANSPNEINSVRVRKYTADAITSLTRTPTERRIAEYVRAFPSRPVAHEVSIYYLQALAVMFGSDNGVIPDHSVVAYLLLAANDYVFEWPKKDPKTLNKKETILANFAKAALFNSRGDPLPFFVRSFLIFERKPPRSSDFRSIEEWQLFQLEALGMSLSNYFETLIAPLVMMSILWGKENNEGRMVPPIIDNPKLWMIDTILPNDAAERFLRSMSLDRDELQSHLHEYIDDSGLPSGLAVFNRFPFLRLPDGKLVAASPWVVQAQLRTGLWAQHLKQAKQQFGKSGAQRWMSAFGDLFEL